jgi:hypothetical protein
MISTKTNQKMFRFQPKQIKKCFGFTHRYQWFQPNKSKNVSEFVNKSEKVSDFVNKSKKVLDFENKPAVIIILLVSKLCLSIIN